MAELSKAFWLKLSRSRTRSFIIIFLSKLYSESTYAYKKDLIEIQLYVNISGSHKKVARKLILMVSLNSFEYIWINIWINFLFSRR